MVHKPFRLIGVCFCALCALSALAALVAVVLELFIDGDDGGDAKLETAYTIYIAPDISHGAGVTYGADVKLTLWKILDRDPIRTDEVLAKLSGDLQMDLIRVPMVAHWEVEAHEEVFDFAATARNNYSMKVFVSVANTDGVLTDSILGNAHHVDKFPDAWQCDGCPNAGTYNLDLDIYQSWLLNLTTMFGVDRMDYLGPFNEDAVDAFDVNMTHMAGVAMVSVEAWGLSTSVTRYPTLYEEARGQFDIAASHDYTTVEDPTWEDDADSLLSAYAKWSTMRGSGDLPVWFTESTLFGKSTTFGIAHMLPAITGGVARIIIYQAVDRLVWANGGEATHYDATHELITYSKGMGAARDVSSTTRELIAAAFLKDAVLHVHLCNVGDTRQGNVTIGLGGEYAITSASLATFGDSGGTPEPASVQVTSRSELQVDIGADTYAHITCFLS